MGAACSVVSCHDAVLSKTHGNGLFAGLSAGACSSCRDRCNSWAWQGRRDDETEPESRADRASPVRGLAAARVRRCRMRLASFCTAFLEALACMLAATGRSKTGVCPGSSPTLPTIIPRDPAVIPSNSLRPDVSLELPLCASLPRTLLSRFATPDHEQACCGQHSHRVNAFSAALDPPTTVVQLRLHIG